jgi:type I restriction enzyme, S subunit
LHRTFDLVIDPIFDEWRRLQDVNKPLAASRDLLLPKLVTGQIDVSRLDLDALTEAATA